MKNKDKDKDKDKTSEAIFREFHQVPDVKEKAQDQKGNWRIAQENCSQGYLVRTYKTTN